jgi:hypothetical protein
LEDFGASPVSWPIRRRARIGVRSWLRLRLATFPGESDQRGRAPVGQDLIATFGIVARADFLLLKEANRVRPAKRCHQSGKSRLVPDSHF